MGMGHGENKGERKRGREGGCRKGRRGGGLRQFRWEVEEEGRRMKGREEWK